MAGIVLERKRTADHIKKEQMKLDYAEVVSKLLILLGAGMSLKQAWNRISAQYSDKRQKKQIKERYIYEEMIITNHEILDGESERLAYQKFGERVDLGEYQRLIRILYRIYRQEAGDYVNFWNRNRRMHWKKGRHWPVNWEKRQERKCCCHS